MSVKIITKHETGGAGDVPLAADLEKGELGVNTVDGKLWVGDGASTKLLTPSGGLVDGLADGNTLRWEASTSEWEATSALVVDDAGNVTASGDVTANAFLGDGSQLTNLPAGTQWDDVTGGINYADGKVGIGTDAPAYPLDVVGTSRFTGGTFYGHDVYQYRSGADTVTWQLGSTDSKYISLAKQGNGVPLFSSVSGDMAFGANNTERMRIDSTGNVGIGTDSPEGKLDVHGNSVDGVESYVTNEENGSQLRLSAGGSNAFGVEVWENSAIVEATGGVGVDQLAIGQPFGGTGAVKFYSGSGRPERMRIDSEGRVGIGTDAPETAMHISGTGVSDSRLTVTRSGVSGIVGVTGNALQLAGLGTDNTDGKIAFYTAAAERMLIDSEGNVKISTGNLELSHGGGWSQVDTTWVRSLADKKVYNGSTAANAFATPGDFTAGYSDMRLKTHLGTIPDALDKVCSLEGFYYERNDTAVELGYQGGERRVGLSAQDVQAVLPEVVKDAPINVDNGTDYLTVDYERVVPLLVEAIKAQQIQIDELKRNQK